MLTSRLKNGAFLIGVAMALGSAAPLMAGSNGDRALEEVGRLSRQGESIFSQAETAVNDGDYARACTLYRNAATVLENAIFATAGMVYDSDYNKDAITSGNAAIQENVDVSKRNAVRFCNAASATSNSSSTFSSGSSGNRTTPGYLLRVYQAQVNSAYLHASDAVERYKTGRFVEACGSARMASANYAWIKSNKPDKQTFDGVYLVESQASENANRAEADVAEFYCKSAKVAAAAPTARVAGGTYRERLDEGLRHQGIANKLNAMAVAELAAKKYGAACDHFRAVSDQWNQSLLLNSLYRSAPEASPSDANDFVKFKENRDLADGNAKTACSARALNALPKFRVTPDHKPKFGGVDLSPAVQAFYDFAAEASLPEVLSEERARTLATQCFSAGYSSAYTSVMGRVCDALLARYPGAKIEACWFYQQGKEVLASIGGFQVPNMGVIYEYSEAHANCNDVWPIHYFNDTENEGLTSVRSTRVIVIKPIPDRPKAAV